MSYRALLLKLQYLVLLVLFAFGVLKYCSWSLLISVPLAFLMAAIATLATAILLAWWLDK